MNFKCSLNVCAIDFETVSLSHINIFWGTDTRQVEIIDSGRPILAYSFQTFLGTDR